MSKPRVFIGAVVVALMVLAAARSSAANPLQSQDSARPSREPIRVDGNAQESKLLHMVEPIYPEQAKAARISGVVILQVIVDEQGNVSEVRVMRGHPLLTNAAVDAVKQWRYAQTFLNGEPVSVIATVTVPFNSGENETAAILDEAGNLRALALQLEGEALLQKLRESKQGLRISASSRLPFRVIEEFVRELQKKGIQEVQVSGFLFREGRLFQTFAISSPGAPEVVLDRERLAEIAKEALNSTNARMPQIPIAYRLLINEIGEVVGIDQQYGPKIPALESELLHAKVITPGRRGVDTVPAALVVEVTGPIMLR